MADEMKKSAGGANDVEENKLWAVLGYLGILCLIPLLGKKDSPFAQYHAKQGLVLLLGWVVFWVPVIGWIIWLGVALLSILGIINALSGKTTPLPLVGSYAEKLNI